MWGIYSYLFTIFIFAGFAIFLEVVFGFHFFKKYLKVISFVVLVSLIFTPPGEATAYLMQTWIYNPATTFYKAVFGAEVETYIFSFCVAIAISSAVIIWTSYEDQGKNVLMQSLRDILKGTYAIWKKRK